MDQNSPLPEHIVSFPSMIPHSDHGAFFPNYNILLFYHHNGNFPELDSCFPAHNINFTEHAAKFLNQHIHLIPCVFILMPDIITMTLYMGYS